MWTKLIFPFRYISGEKAFLAALVGHVAFAFLARELELHFNGTFNIKFIQSDPSVWVYWSEPFINTLVLTVILGVIALLMKKHFRWIDLAGMLLLARLPLSFSLFAFLITGVTKSSSEELIKALPEASGDLDQLSSFLGLALITLPLLVYAVHLMYQAFSLSTNIKKIRGVVSFIGALVATEIILAIVYSNLYAL